MFYTKILLQSYAVKSSPYREAIKERRATVFYHPPLDGIFVLSCHEAEIAVHACQIMLQLVGNIHAEGVNMCQKLLQFTQDVYQSAYRAIGEVHPVHLDNRSYEIHALRHVLYVLLVVVHTQIELLVKEYFCLVTQHQYILLPAAYQGEIVHEAFISRSCRPAQTYHILVEERHIEVGQQLRGDVADGHTSEAFCKEE